MLISMTPTAPVERSVDVTFTLSFPESEIFSHLNDRDLAVWLAGELRNINENDWQAVYSAARKLKQ